MIIWKAETPLPKRKPDYTLEIIGEVPPTGNSLIHADKWVYTNQAKKWTGAKLTRGDKKDGLIASSFFEKYGDYSKIKPFKKAIGRIIFYWSHKRDRANWAFCGLKFIEDALQYINVIENDDPEKWECQIEFYKCKKTDIKTVIEVWNLIS